MHNTIPVAAGKFGDKLVGTLRRLPAQLSDFPDITRHKARDAVRTAEKAVRHHPYAAVGIAAAAGLIIGLLATRR